MRACSIFLFFWNFFLRSLYSLRKLCMMYSIFPFVYCGVLYPNMLLGFFAIAYIMTYLNLIICARASCSCM